MLYCKLCGNLIPKSRLVKGGTIRVFCSTECNRSYFRIKNKYNPEKRRNIRPEIIPYNPNFVDQSFQGDDLVN